MNSYSKALSDYFNLVEKNKPKLAAIYTQSDKVIPKRYVSSIIRANTTNNLAGGGANLASQQIESNKRGTMQVKHDRKGALMIYTQQGQVKANQKILDQLITFQRSMKELARHYWNCFPANHQRLRKAKIIVDHLTDYKKKLYEFQRLLQSKNKSEQKILCQELIDLAEKVTEHYKTTDLSLKQKKEKLKQISKEKKS